MTKTQGTSPSDKAPAEGDRKTVEKDLARVDRGGQQGGYHPQKEQGADHKEGLAHEDSQKLGRSGDRNEGLLHGKKA